MSNTSHPAQNIVVFDLDETLGNFVEVGMFWDALENYYGRKLSDETFFEILDIFPEFLRPNIVKILKYLMDKKRIGECSKVMIYTNNQGPRSWAKMISAYFDTRTGQKTFDQIIAAFKVHGKVVEICRTSHDKSVEDLIKCTRIPANTEICFLDDQYHPLMEHDQVYYINVKPYTFSMGFREMAERYLERSHVHGVEPDQYSDFVGSVVRYMKRYRYTVTQKPAAEVKVDEVISKKIIIHLEEFFNKNKSKKQTRKRRRRSKRGTRRR